MPSPELLSTDRHAHKSLQGHKFNSHEMLFLYDSGCLMYEKQLHRQAGLGTICTSKTSELHFPCFVKLSISGFHSQVYTTVSGFCWAWMWKKCCVPLPKSLSTHQTPSGFHSATLKILSPSTLCLKEILLVYICVCVCVCANTQTSLHVALF